MAGTTIASPNFNEVVTTGVTVQGESSLVKIAATYTGLISLIGLMLNILIIAVILILKDYKYTRQWYVLNLATANGLHLLMVLVSLQQGVTGSWSTGVPACVAFQGGLFASYYAGILLLVVMSFDLYVAIAHPISKSWKRIRSKPGFLILAAAMWGLAIATAIPIMVNSSVINNRCDYSFDRIHPESPLYEKKSVNETNLIIDFGDSYPMNGFYRDFVSGDDEMLYYPIAVFTLDYYNEPVEDEADCFPDVTEGYSTWVVIKFILTFAIPFTLMTCSYCGILYRFHRPSTRAAFGSPNTRSHNNTSSGNSKGDGSVREIVFVASLVAAFVICWSPLHGVSLARFRGITLSLDACYKLRNGVVLLANSNSFVNPILCILLGIDFRKKLKLSASRLCGESCAQKCPCSGKKDASESTKVPLSKPDVPLATIRLNQADENNDVVDIEAQT